MWEKILSGFLSPIKLAVTNAGLIFGPQKLDEKKVKLTRRQSAWAHCE